MTKRQRVVRWSVRVFVIAGSIWLIGMLALAALIVHTGNTDRAEPSDVIIVLGAGVNRNGSAGWALTRRSRHAAELWHDGYAPMILCTGGQAPSRPNSEAAACREVLLREGVPTSAILLEDRSRSTEENALNSRRILQERGWQQALLVSDSYHVFRAGILFRTRGVEVALSPVPAERIPRRSFYVSSVIREIAALHWQVVKDALQLPITHIP